MKDLGANTFVFSETDMDALWTMIEQRLGTTANLVWAFHKDTYLYITFTHVHSMYISSVPHPRIHFRRDGV